MSSRLNQSIFKHNFLTRKMLSRWLPFNLNKPFKQFGNERKPDTKFIWMGSKGLSDSYRIQNDMYKEIPLDLSYYLLMRTKEKMLLEA